MNEKTKANLIFDLDDTLIDTSSVILRRIVLLLNDYPITEGAFYIHNLLSNPEREDILGKRYKFAKQFWTDYERLRSDIRPKCIGNVKRKLEFLASKEHKIGILTNNSEKKVIEFLSQSSIDRTFFNLGIYTVDNLKYTKPNPQCFDQIKSDCSRGKICYIGDSLLDFYTSRVAQIQFAGVCTGLISRATFLLAGLDKNRIFNDVHEVNF